MRIFISLASLRNVITSKIKLKENVLQTLGMAKFQIPRTLRVFGIENFTNPRACKTYSFNLIFEIIPHSFDTMY